MYLRLGSAPGAGAGTRAGSYQVSRQLNGVVIAGAGAAHAEADDDGNTTDEPLPPPPPSTQAAPRRATDLSREFEDTEDGSVSSPSFRTGLLTEEGFTTDGSLDGSIHRYVGVPIHTVGFPMVNYDPALVLHEGPLQVVRDHCLCLSLLSLSLSLSVSLCLSVSVLCCALPVSLAVDPVPFHQNDAAVVVIVAPVRNWPPGQEVTAAMGGSRTKRPARLQVHRCAEARHAGWQGDRYRGRAMGGG